MAERELTAIRDEDDVVRGLMLEGAADLRRVADAGLPLLHKPVGTDRLLAAIEAALNDPPTGGGATGQNGADCDHEDPAGR